MIVGDLQLALVGNCISNELEDDYGTNPTSSTPDVRGILIPSTRWPYRYHRSWLPYRLHTQPFPDKVTARCDN